MKEIILYTTNCPLCKMVKRRIENEKYSYREVSDKEAVMAVAKQHNIMCVPFIDYNGVIYQRDDLDKLFEIIKSEKAVC